MLTIVIDNLNAVGRNGARELVKLCRFRAMRFPICDEQRKPTGDTSQQQW